MDLANRRSSRCEGYLPSNRWAEDGTVCTTTYPDLRRLPDEASLSLANSINARTRRNVAETDGTLFLFWGNRQQSNAIKLEIDREQQARGEPQPVCLEVDLQTVRTDTTSAEVRKVAQWVRQQGIQTLNIDGPSESESPGIYAAASNFLGLLFSGWQARLPVHATCEPATDDMSKQGIDRVDRIRQDTVWNIFLFAAALGWWLGCFLLGATSMMLLGYAANLDGYAGMESSGSAAGAVLGAMAVIGAGYAVYHYQGLRGQDRALIDLAEYFDSAEFIRQRGLANRSLLNDPTLEIHRRDEYDSQYVSAFYAVFAFYQLVALSVINGTVSKDAALNYFGGSFTWWYVHGIRQNCPCRINHHRDQQGPSNICKRHRYPEEWDPDQLLNRLFNECMWHRLGEDWLNHAKQQYGDML